MSEKLAELPAVNWLVHVLNQPVPPGVELQLDRSKGASQDHWAKFDTEGTRAMFLEMARLFKQYEQEMHRLMGEGRAAEWHSASEPPEIGPVSSFHYRHALVYSPVLSFVGSGVTRGRYSIFEGPKWEVQVNGKWVEYTPTHWRLVPPPPGPCPDYKDVEAEVVRFRELADLPTKG